MAVTIDNLSVEDRRLRGLELTFGLLSIVFAIAISIGLRFFLGTILLFILILVFAFYYNKYNDIFHPMCFFAILSSLRYVPSVYSGKTDTYVLLTDEGLSIFVFYTLITILFVCGGYEFYVKHIKKTFVSIIEGGINKKPFSIGLTLFVIGVLSRIVFINISGGLNYILSNIQQKLSIVSGYGYLLALGSFMTFGIIYMLTSNYLKYNKNKKILFLLILIFILINLFLLGFMSDRTAPIRSLMIIVMAYHYHHKKIYLSSLFSPKILVIVLASIVFIVAMPLLRNSQGFDYYGSVTDLISGALDNVFKIFLWFSYTGRDVFIFQHFNIDNYWLGSNVLNLLYAPIPKALYNQKPPVDEGFYLSNLVMGYDSSPPDYTWYYNSSFPFDNQGIMYANFGITGLIIGAIAIGMVYAKTYKFLRANHYHPIAIVLTQYVMYNFAFTSHDIVAILATCFYMIFPLYITRNIKFRKEIYSI